MDAVGIVANPISGKDVRRLLTNAGTSTLEDKVGVVRRCLVGAHEAGARRFVVLPDPHGIVRRALQTLPFSDELDVADAVATRHHDERDTTAAAAAMADAGCTAVVVLGGDGTNRAVAIGWPGAPVIPVSTGTNNAFPSAVEATAAGAAAGHLATRRVSLAEVAAPAKVVQVGVEGEDDDVALVDAVMLAEPSSGRGSLKPFDPTALVVAVLSRAQPAAVGVSSVGAVLCPTSAAADNGLEVRFGPPDGDGSTTVRAPLAPGTYVDVAVASWRVVEPHHDVVVEGPGVLAFDGDRRRVLTPGQRATLTVARSGPRVIDVARVLGTEAVRRHWQRR